MGSYGDRRRPVYKWRGEVRNLVFYAQLAITVISGHWGWGAMETGDCLYTSGGGEVPMIRVVL